MWFDDFSKKPLETIQRSGMKAVDLEEMDERISSKQTGPRYKGDKSITRTLTLHTQ